MQVELLLSSGAERVRCVLEQLEGVQREALLQIVLPLRERIQSLQHLVVELLRIVSDQVEGLR